MAVHWTETGTHDGAKCTPFRLPRRQVLAFAFVLPFLLAVTALCFSPALTGPFIFDDFPNLENLKQLNDGVSPAAIGRYLAAVQGSPARPLAMLSFLVEDAAWPAYPADYKRNNLLFHLLAGLLVAWLAFRLSAYTQVKAHRRVWATVACTAAWLLNPMQLSATMLVVQRMNILATIFVLAGLLSYISVIESRRLCGVARTLVAGAVLGTFAALAYLCKENGVLIFAFAFVLNITLLRPALALYSPLARRLLLLGTGAPVIGIFAYLAARWNWLQSLYMTRDFTMAERLLTQPRVLVDSVAHVFLPRIGGQGILHDDIVVSRSLTDPPSTLACLLLIALAAMAGLMLRRRAAVFSFAILWFLAGHLLESTVLPLEMYFEHRNYLPMMGLLFALSYAVARINTSFVNPLAFLLALWIAGCGILTWINAATWGNRGVSSLVWVQEHPRSPRAVQWAASYLLETGNTERARKVLSEGAERIPESADLRLQLALLDCLTRGVTAEQWQQAVDAARTSGHSHLAPKVFGDLVDQVGGGKCHGTLTGDMALRMGQALIGNDAFARVPATLSSIHYELAQLFAYERNLPLVISHMDMAYHLDPKPLIPREQAVVLLRAGEPRAALRYLDISDRAPQPWMKRWLHDPSTTNAVLRRQAEAMLERE